MIHASRISPAVFLLSIATAIAPDARASAGYSSEEYFKNYALSTCLADGYESKEVFKDAAAAARGYLEFGDLPLEAHTEATLLGRKFLSREYKGLTGEKLILMKCLDFYHSDELQNIIRKYQSRKE